MPTLSDSVRNAWPPVLFARASTVISGLDTVAKHAAPVQTATSSSIGNGSWVVTEPAPAEVAVRR